MADGEAYTDDYQRHLARIAEAKRKAEETRKRIEASHRQQEKRPKQSKRIRLALNRMQQRERWRIQKERDPQRLLEWNRARNRMSFLNDPERKRARGRKDYYKHREMRLLKDAVYRREHRNELSTYFKQHRNELMANPESAAKYRQYHREWMAAYRAKKRAQQQQQDDQP